MGSRAAAAAPYRPACGAAAVVGMLTGPATTCVGGGGRPGRARFKRALRRMLQHCTCTACVQRSAPCMHAWRRPVHVHVDAAGWLCVCIGRYSTVSASLDGPPAQGIDRGGCPVVLRPSVLYAHLHTVVVLPCVPGQAYGVQHCTASEERYMPIVEAVRCMALMDPLMQAAAACPCITPPTHHPTGCVRPPPAAGHGTRLTGGDTAAGQAVC